MLPTIMVVRNVFDSPLLTELQRGGLADFAFLGASKPDNIRDEETGFSWFDIQKPEKLAPTARPSLAQRFKRLAWKLAGLLLWGRLGFGQLAFRFNEISGFTGHRLRLKLSDEAKKKEALAGNYADPKLGWPFPGSHLIYRFLYRFYYSTWQPGDPSVEAFFDRWRPDLLVLYHIQHPQITPYAVAARRRSLPITGIVGSWDQLTTKGPICPGITRCYVQNEMMRGEASAFHDFPKSNVEVTGWPQMDPYLDPKVLRPYVDFSQELGVLPDRGFILYAAVSNRRGPQEPTLVRHLLDRIKSGAYPGSPVLIVRPHPRDKEWRERFAFLENEDGARLFPAERGRLDFLANLLKHAKLVICTASTISLDAVAFDTCVVNIGFDDDHDKPWHGAYKDWYDLNHYAQVVATGGVKLVEGFAELDNAIQAYLDDPGLDARGRALLRQQFLEPLDGRASQRIAAFIHNDALRAISG